MFETNAVISMTLSGVGILLMVMVLMIIILRKRKGATVKPMIFLALLEISTQVYIIMEWVLYGYDMTHLLIYKVSVVLTFVNYCLAMVCILWYIVAYFEDTKSMYDIKEVKVFKRPVLYGLIVGLSCIAIYLIALKFEVFLYFNEKGEEFFTNYNVVPFLLALLIFVPVIPLIFKNARTIGYGKSFLLMAYWWVPTLFLLSDYLLGINLAAFGLVVLIFFMIANFDIMQNEAFLAREAMHARIEAELSENRSRLMLSQIQPHFLFNSLNVISALCDENPGLARQATSTFADYLRENVNTINITKPVPFANELRHVKGYTWLESLRFGERVKIEYDISVSGFEIPTLTVQPIVENAIKHGVCKKDGGGCVWISTEETLEDYLVTIKDDGVGFDPNETLNDEKVHVGIENVRNRLELMVNGSLEIISAPGHGTTAIIRIPKNINPYTF